MVWTKQTKSEDGNQGFLEPPGFLVSGFLESVSAWVKLAKASDTWIKISEVTDSWTKQTKA